MMRPVVLAALALALILAASPAVAQPKKGAKRAVPAKAPAAAPAPAAEPKPSVSYLEDAPTTPPVYAKKKKRRGFAKFLRKVEDHSEKALGLLVTGGLEAMHGINKDPGLNARLARVAAHIEAAYDRDVDLKFKILNMDVVNAFACPGGTIYVTPAMLHFVASDSELAFVLGHEAGHIAGRHSMKALEQGMALDYLIRKNVKKNQDAARIASAFLSLSYSRANEFDSDDYGFRVMTAAGFNPQAAVSFMDKMKRSFEEKKNPKFLTWLQTHPSLHDRYGRMVSQFEAVKATNPAYLNSLTRK